MAIRMAGVLQLHLRPRRSQPRSPRPPTCKTPGVGTGISSLYLPHVFDHGWTPEVARREEKSSSGLGKEITWWSEPTEFGIVYCDSSAIEHVVVNLVDNAVRHSSTHVEVKLSKNPSHFFIRVWDDGPGISSLYLPHVFDHGWTPEVARREEKSSSGLGLFIARTLARSAGGDITVDSVTGPDADHHTEFLVGIPLNVPQISQD